MDFELFVALSDSYKYTDTLWIIIIVMLVVLLVIAIINEVLRRTNRERYLKTLSYFYLILCGGISFCCPLIFVWWVAAFTVIGALFFIRFEEKTDLYKFFKSEETQSTDYSQYMTKIPATIAVSVVSYLLGGLVFYNICIK